MTDHHHHGDGILSRRHLLAGSSAFLTLGGGLRVAFADTPLSSIATTGVAAAPTNNNPILVAIFCRFGQDGMQLVAPAEDSNYISNRPTIGIPPSGPGAGLPLGSLDGVNFYFHPLVPELLAMYNAGQLAPIVAAGVPTVIRSHFEAQDMMERGGADGMTNPDTGWLARHIASVGAKQTSLSTISMSSNTPTSLTGDNEAIAIPSPAGYNVSGGAHTTSVSQTLLTGTTAYEAKAMELINSISTVQSSYAALSGNNQNGLGYTNGDLSTALKALATMIKMNVGVTVATVDMGSWDHHQNLTPNFNARATELSKAISAFWKDITAYQQQTTIVTMTEFGRRFTENASHGLDHGSASTMMVMSSKMNGGKIYGQWPGLAANQLFGGDLAVTTDYRQVLSEVIVKAHGEPNVANVFPTVNYQPLGLFS